MFDGTALLGLILALAPYSGPALNGAVPDTAKFAVSISGAASQPVRLRAIGVPKGYIASFCTNLVCAPFAVTLRLPASGHERVELQLIQNVPHARRPATVRVAADGASPVSIAFRRATY